VKLSVREAVARAAVIFEINTEREGVLALGASAGLCPQNSDSLILAELTEPKARFLWEWSAFVHAAVLYGLMEHAPAVTVVEYLRGTSELMERNGYDKEQIELFTDTAFKAYSEALINKRPQDCPSIFFKRFSDSDLKDVDYGSAARISTAMAMMLSASLDTFEK